MSAGQLRILKSRIRSVENTKKITRAMEMVSAAKLRRFQKMMTEAAPYTASLEQMLINLTRDQGSASERTSSSFSHPFLEERKEKNSALVFITSDSGLCGPYNMDLIQIARDFLKEKENEGYGSPFLFGIGKSGISALTRNGYTFNGKYTEIRGHQVEETIKKLKDQLEQRYLNREVDAVYVVYSHFINTATQKPIVEKILPFKQEMETMEAVSGPSASTAVPYIYEPTPEFIFNKLIPFFFEAKIRILFLEAFVSEHTARMNAMHQATKNAKEMIDSLVLFRNKIRQAIITKEIIEIISGSQALKK